MTNPIIKPTVGRVVLFHPSELTGEASFVRHPDDQPYAAIIARVWSDSMVNLTVMDANGDPHSRTSVPLVQDSDSRPGNGFYCEWMPYQKGQAAKTEAAEKNASTTSGEYRQRSQREQLEYALVSGAAPHLAHVPDQAGRIAQGIKSVLDALHPQPVLLNPHTGMLRDARDVASDPQAKLCVKLGESLKAAAASRSVTSVTYRVPDSLEREIQAKASIAPRVTPADIEAEIVDERYFTAKDGCIGGYSDAYELIGPALDKLGLVTFCVLTLKNETKIVGVNEGPVSPENFDAEIGRRIAREKAVDQIWPMLGYRLRDVLARPVLTEADAAADRLDAPRPDNPNA